MKIAILVVVLGMTALLLAILYMLFQPCDGSKAPQPSLRSRQAAVGRAALELAQHDPAVAAMVRAAVRAAPEQDQVLASKLISELPQP